MRLRLWGASVLALVGICAILFQYSYHVARRDSIDRLEKEQDLYARQASLGIGDFFASWKGTLTSLAQVEDVRDLTPEGKRMMAQFFEAHKHQTRSITRTDSNGTITYSFPDTAVINTDISSQQHVREIIDSHVPVVSGVFRSVQGDDVVAIHVPVFKDGTYEGSIATTIDFQALAGRFLSMVRIGETGRAWVVSRDGIELFGSLPQHLGKLASENHRSCPSILTMLDDMLAGRSGVGNYHCGDQLSGKKMHGVYLPINLGNTFWSVAVSIAEDEAVSSLTSFRERLAVITLFVFLLGTWGSFLIIKARFIVREDAARREANKVLQRLNADLEHLVAERTAELEERNRELETFTYSVSHDLKAPLRGLDGYSRLLLQDHAGQLDEEGRAFLQTIRRAAQNMSQLIDDLLAYSKLERRSLQPGLVDLRALVESLLTEREEEISSRGMTVSVDVPSTPVTADPDGLAQAVRNLLDNALKFTRSAPQPTIAVGGHETATAHVLWVRDNGVGFDMRFHQRIFEIFQRLHREEDYPGTGIGLAIVKKALERMGGRAWAESTPGQGATFWLEIPK